MCPSTDATEAERQFSAGVLRNLLQHIEKENASGHGPYLVSHAWVEGPMVFVVYTAPPSDQIWGLARDTRESIIDPAPWPDIDEAVLTYYLVDFEENQPSAASRRPGDPDTIWWFGYPQDNVPDRPSDIPTSYRYAQPTAPVATAAEAPPDIEPRRYGNTI
jgi:hypothetical protein